MLQKLHKTKLLIIPVTIVVSAILVCAGLFVFREERHTTEMEKTGTGEKKKEFYSPIPEPVVHRHLILSINGRKQKVNLLEVNLGDSRVELLPVLSHDLVYGYETLSSMFARSNAYAAVNGGFFYDYGLPGGMVALDGKLITASSGKYPVLVMEAGKASLKEISTRLWIVHNGQRIVVDRVNMPWNMGKTVVYTPLYGSSNRAKVDNTTIVIKEGTVSEIKTGRRETGIPEDGLLVTFYHPDGYSKGDLPVKKGDKVEFGFDPDLGKGVHAYECGSWLVKDGQVVAPDRDSWTGVLTNHDPRTAVGIKDGSRVILLTVDGRQPGYSAGLTGKELGELMLELGAKDAAMLDGGASTEMIVEGNIVNRPSFRGEERPLGGAVIVRLNNR